MQKKIDWDWRLLAALICQESKFSASVRSSRGAHGLMQIKKETARQAGIQDVYDPEQNISAGTMLIKRLVNKFNKENIDSVNSVKFILAAYNAGDGRLEDVRSFARHKSENPDDWNSLVKIIPMMRESEAIPVGILRFGTFNGKETIRFVEEVLSRYEEYKSFTSP